MTQIRKFYEADDRDVPRATGSTLPIQAEKREDEMEFLLPPDEGEGWNIGSETFTRREVFNLLHTQRAMISNDIKRECNLDSQDILLSILNNPRIPKF